jgi:hypothetical protein
MRSAVLKVAWQLLVRSYAAAAFALHLPASSSWLKQSLDESIKHYPLILK